MCKKSNVVKLPTGLRNLVFAICRFSQVVFTTTSNLTPSRLPLLPIVYSLSLRLSVRLLVCLHLVSGKFGYFLLLIESLLPNLKINCHWQWWIFPNTQIQRFDRNASNSLLSSIVFEAPHQAGPSEVAPQPSTLQPPPPAPVQNHPQLPHSDSEFDFIYLLYGNNCKVIPN